MTRVRSGKSMAAWCTPTRILVSGWKMRRISRVTKVNMIPFPEPLHPAVVHFPIALLLVGAGVAVLSVFIRRWHLPLFAAVLLTLGAIGAVAATVTGEEEEEKVEHAIPSAEPVLEEHATWGERARNAGIVAAALAIVAVIVARKPGRRTRGLGRHGRRGFGRRLLRGPSRALWWRAGLPPWGRSPDEWTGASAGKHHGTGCGRSGQAPGRNLGGLAGAASGVADCSESLAASEG